MKKCDKQDYKLRARAGSSMIGISLGAQKAHLLLRQVDIRSNYHACYAGMRNSKITRNVCITLGQMCPFRVEVPPREILVRLSFASRIRVAVVIVQFASRCLFFLVVQASGLSINRKS